MIRRSRDTQQEGWREGERKEKRVRGEQERERERGYFNYSIGWPIELYPRIRRWRRRIGAAERGGRHKADHGGQRTLPIAKITHRVEKNNSIEFVILSSVPLFEKRLLLLEEFGRSRADTEFRLIKAGGEREKSMRLKRRPAQAIGSRARSSSQRLLADS